MAIFISCRKKSFLKHCVLALVQMGKFKIGVGKEVREGLSLGTTLSAFLSYHCYITFGLI
jgi:hypothetical protein